MLSMAEYRRLARTVFRPRRPGEPLTIFDLPRPLIPVQAASLASAMPILTVLKGCVHPLMAFVYCPSPLGGDLVKSFAAL
jgi:hypothetical protein